MKEKKPSLRQIHLDTVARSKKVYFATEAEAIATATTATCIFKDTIYIYIDTAQAYEQRYVASDYNGLTNNKTISMLGWVKEGKWIQIL